MSTRTATPIIRGAEEGEKRWFSGGGTHTWKVTAEETAGAFYAFEDFMSEGKMTPLHSHPLADEMTYVLEGEILMRLGDREQRVGPGGVVMAPRGVAHAFRVMSAQARMLFVQAPGDGASFYWNASVPATSDGEGPVDFAKVQEWAAKTGAVDILGPPPFATS
jgi:quercetin dioxygenase-like cupin family protein